MINKLLIVAGLIALSSCSSESDEAKKLDGKLLMDQEGTIFKLKHHLGKTFLVEKIDGVKYK